MGYDQLKSFGAVAVLGLGLAIALAAPAFAGTGAAQDTTRTTTSAPIVHPEAAAVDKPVVVAGKYEKNWKKANKNWNKNWNRNYNKKVVVVRPYRKWYKRPHYGTVIGGVALGAILGAAAYNAGPPAPNLCWYWADPYRSRGYWDYCY